MNEVDENWREQGLRDSALEGHTTAWRTLYDTAFEGVAGYVRWRCGGLVDLADDVVQETWLTAARRLSAFDPHQCRFATWVCGIARNVLRHQLRSRSRYQRRVGYLGDVEPMARRCEADREQSERVAVVLANLPERYEQVLRAKYFDRQSVNEIATAWGDSPKAIESLLTRARQAFREEFEKHP